MSRIKWFDSMTIKILLILIYPDQITSLVGFEQRWKFKENEAEQKKTSDYWCKPYPKSYETRQIRSLGKQECTNKKENANVRREGKRKFMENKRRKWRKESVL